LHHNFRVRHSTYELDEGHDPRDATTLEGKSDYAGIAEGTVEALGVLRVANELSLDELRRAIRLSSRVASALIQRRPIDTLAALDAVPGIGPVSMSRMLQYARANGLVPGALPTFPVPSWAGVFSQPECSGPELTDAIKFRMLGDRERLVLGQLTYFHKYDAPCEHGLCGTRYEAAPVANLTLVRRVRRADITLITATVEIEPIPAAQTVDGCMTNVPGGRCDVRGFESLRRGPARLRVTRDCVSLVRASTDTGGVATPVRELAKGSWNPQLPPFRWFGPIGGVADFAPIPTARSDGRRAIAVTEQRYFNNGEARVMSELGTQVSPVAGPDKIAADETHVYYTTVNEDECGVWRVAHGQAQPDLVTGWACYVQSGVRTVPRALALDSTHVYYAALTQRPSATLGPRWTTNIMRIPKSGGDAAIVAYGVPSSNFERRATSTLAMDDTHVYWSEPYAGRVLRARKVPPATAAVGQVLAQGERSPNAVTLDGDRVLFATDDRYNIAAAVPKAGGPVTRVAASVPGGQILSFAVDGAYVYASGPGGVFRLSRTGGTWETIARDVTITGTRVALVEGYVLWAAAGGVFALER
jgi:hypothetical protein